LIQCASEIGKIKDNLKRLEKLCRTAAQQNAKILILPEASITGYLSSDLKINWHIPGRPIDHSFVAKELTTEYAEPQNGPSVQYFAALATELGVYITVPFIEIDPNGNFFNAVSLVGPKQTLALAHYRKNCPWPVPEKSWATPGADVTGAIFETEYGRVGMAICFDIHSILAKYHDKGLWALLYPIAWVGNTESWFGFQLPARLREVNCPFYILGTNWASVCPQSWQGLSGSTVYAPGGDIVASSQQLFGEDIVYAEIPTQGHMRKVGTLDLIKYKKWTDGQIGTDFWINNTLNLK
jgi:predicted amidohydrolase